MSRTILREPRLLGAAQQAPELPGELRDWTHARAERAAARVCSERSCGSWAGVSPLHHQTAVAGSARASLFAALKEPRRIAHSRDYFRQADDYPMTTSGTGVCNVFLANLVDLGMVGNALWAFAFVVGVGVGEALWRIQPPELLPWRTSLLALAVAWLTVANLSPLNTSFPNTILWLWAGIVWRPRVAPETIPVLEREPERPAPGAVRAGVAA